MKFISKSGRLYDTRIEMVLANIGHHFVKNDEDLMDYEEFENDCDESLDDDSDKPGTECDNNNDGTDDSDNIDNNESTSDENIIMVSTQPKRFRHDGEPLFTEYRVAKDIPGDIYIPKKYSIEHLWNITTPKEGIRQNMIQLGEFIFIRYDDYPEIGNSTLLISKTKKIVNDFYGNYVPKLQAAYYFIYKQEDGFVVSDSSASPITSFIDKNCTNLEKYIPLHGLNNAIEELIDNIHLYIINDMADGITIDDNQ